MSKLTIYAPDSFEYKTFQRCIQELSSFCNQNNINLYFTIETLYFDAGQGWMYTTIIANEPNNNSVTGRYHLLNPRDYEFIIGGSCGSYLKGLNNVKEELMERYVK